PRSAAKPPASKQRTTIPAPMTHDVIGTGETNFPDAIAGKILGARRSANTTEANATQPLMDGKYRFMINLFAPPRAIAKMNFRNGGRRAAGRRGKPAGLPHHFGNYFCQPV